MAYPAPGQAGARAPQPPPPAPTIPPPLPPQQPPVTPDPDEREERVKRRIALLIATVALFGALLAYLKTDASAHGDTAKREAKRLAIEATGAKVSSQAELGYELTAARLWLELGQLIDSARKAGPLSQPDTGQAQGSGTPQPVNPDQWYQAARDSLEALSPMLKAPYNGDYRRYLADTSLVPATLLSERSIEASRQDEQWGGKASGYVLELAILAVSLALLGLSTTMRGRQRIFCLLVGGGIVAATMGAALLTFISPVRIVPDEAIEAYARGVGLAYQGKSADPNVAGSLTRSAVSAFDEALGQAPGYASALFDKANAQYALKDYTGAVADYEAAIAAGRSDTGALWNLGWTYFVLGRFDDAVREDRQALSDNPDLVAVRLNLGLSLLASGKADEAQQEYQKGIDKAAELVAGAANKGPQLPYSFWVQLDRAALDLDALVHSMDGSGHSWEEAPAAGTVSGGNVVREAAIRMAGRLKEVSVSLEYNGRIDEAAGNPTVSAFAFAPPGGKGPDTGPAVTPFEAGMGPGVAGQTLLPPASSDITTTEVTFSSDLVTDTFRYNPDKGIVVPAVLIFFDYSSIEPGSTLVWKVYRDGQEDHSLRRKEEWQNHASGKALGVIQFVFQSAGEYNVELFVNSRLVQQGTFHIVKADS